METWAIAIPQRETKCDTLWISSDGRYCLTDGTNPRHVDTGNVEDYVLDTAALSRPIVLTETVSSFCVPFPRLDPKHPVGQTVFAARVLQEYFLKKGVISQPLTFVL